MKYMLFLTRLEKLEGTYFIDSTAVLYHLARGMTGLFRHYFYRIGNFLIGPLHSFFGGTSKGLKLKFRPKNK
jgi:hypothetical protein